MNYQPRSTNPYIMEKKLNECVGGGGLDPSVLEEIEGSLNSINDNLTNLDNNKQNKAWTTLVSSDAQEVSINLPATWSELSLMLYAYPTSSGSNGITRHIQKDMLSKKTTWGSLTEKVSFIVGNATYTFDLIIEETKITGRVYNSADNNVTGRMALSYR